MSTAEVLTGAQLLSAEEFRRLPDRGLELVRGKVVKLAPPGFRHGRLCGNIVYLLRDFLRLHDLGQIVCNDSGIVTHRAPDSVRGADVAFYSYHRVPRGTDPEGYPEAAPDIVFEVRSPSDRWSNVLDKVSEYLAAGVSYVCVLHSTRQIAIVYQAEDPETLLSGSELLSFPEVLPGFQVAVSALFE